MAISNAQRLGAARAVEPQEIESAHHEDRRDERRENTGDERDREAFYRTGAVLIQHGRGEGRRSVGGGAEARADLLRLRDAKRHRQRAGAEHEREILCFSEPFAAHRDLAAGADRGLDNWRRHNTSIEDDRHEILNMLASFAAEAAAA